MGVQNVSLVYARWVHLPDRAFRVLGFMALRTIDEDDPPLYWGGRESLAYALGRMTPVEPAESDRSPRADAFRKARAADFQAVKVAMQELTNSGAVAIHSRATARRHAVYRLELLASTGYGEPTGVGRQNVPEGYVHPTEPGRAGLPHRNKGYEQEGTNQGTISSLATTSPAEMTPEKANAILTKLGPDEYERLMAAAMLRFGATDLMLNAARIALEEKPRLEIVKGEMA